MRVSFKVLVVCVFCASSSAAQEEDGPSLMERGAQQFLEGLLQEMEPAWRELQEFMDAMGPAMIELMDDVKDWSDYEPPEILDNGDIIIRRKPELPVPEAEPEQQQPPQIEL